MRAKPGAIKMKDARLVTAGRLDRDKRIDIFLSERLPGVPKNVIYRVIKSGEVRVNSGRIKPTYKIKVGDEVRIPPIRAEQGEKAAAKPKLAPFPVLFEDEHIYAIQKPAGYAVQPAKGVPPGKVVESLLQRFDSKLALAHRLDRDTSGILLLAKNPEALKGLENAFRLQQVDKEYLTLVRGTWHYTSPFAARFPLRRERKESGELRVSVSPSGQEAHSIFKLEKRFETSALMRVKILTGRTHQIRVHAAHLEAPVAGDGIYGDYRWNKELESQGLKRMFLHAAHIVFNHPISGKRVTIEAPLPEDLEKFLGDWT